MIHKPPPRTSGYRRRGQTPDPHSARVCKSCNLWFVPRPRESVCDDCVPAPTRVKRLALAPHTRTRKEAHGTAGQGHRSDVLGLTFKPGVPLYRILALEAAAEQRWKGKR